MDSKKQRYETYKWIFSLVDDQVEDLPVDEYQPCSSISVHKRFYYYFYYFTLLPTGEAD